LQPALLMQSDGFIQLQSNLNSQCIIGGREVADVLDFMRHSSFCESIDEI
jgi:hypothetical protein